MNAFGEFQSAVRNGKTPGMRAAQRYVALLKGLTVAEQELVIVGGRKPAGERTPEEVAAMTKRENIGIARAQRDMLRQMTARERILWQRANVQADGWADKVLHDLGG